MWVSKRPQVDSVGQSDRPSKETVVQYKTNPVWISKRPHVDSVGQSSRPREKSVGQYKTDHRPCVDQSGRRSKGSVC